MLTSLSSRTTTSVFVNSVARRCFAIKGDSSAPLVNLTIGQLLDQSSVGAFEHKDVFRDVRTSAKMTWSEFKNYVDSFAVGYAYRKLTTDNSTAIYAKLSRELVMAPLAYGRIPAISVFLDAKSEKEFKEQLLKVRAKSIFVSEDCIDVALNGFPEISRREITNSVRQPDYPELRIMATSVNNISGYHNIEDLRVHDPIPSPLPRLAQNISSSSLFTSSLNAQYTQSAAINTGKVVAGYLELSTADRVLTTINISDPAGYAIGVLSVLTSKSTLILPKNTTAENIIHDFVQEEATVLSIHASQLQQVLNDSHFSGFPRLKKLLIVQNTATNESVDSIAQEVSSKLPGVKAFVAYTNPDAGLFLVKDLQSQTAQPAPHTQLKVVGDNGKEAQDVQRGKLYVSGALAPIKSSQSSDGWHFTGLTASIEQGAVRL